MGRFPLAAAAACFWRISAGFGVISLLLPAACSTVPNTPPPVEIHTVTVTKEVQRPCPVERPAVPARLAKPYPTDLGQLAALLAAKLFEYSGPGRYAERADSALAKCVTP